MKFLSSPALSLASWMLSDFVTVLGNGSVQQDFGKVISSSSLGFSWDNIRHVYAFGDSYTFVQGTHGLANFSFIGDFQNLSFTKEELFSDEIIFRNTSSDGANWIEFLTGCFRGKPSDCTPRQLWNFAFAGADIDGNLLPLHHPFTIPLVDQVKQWAMYASIFLPRPKTHTLTAWWIGINDTGDSTGNTTTHTLTAWWIGINDTGDSTGNTTITDFASFYEKEMDSLFSAVDLAYTTGLTGAHLFLTVPPMERSPSGLASSRSQLQKSNIIEYNYQLLSHAQQFAKIHPRVPVFVFDAHAWFNFALDNAGELGFRNTTGFCECTDSGFFWYNSVNAPTQDSSGTILATPQKIRTDFFRTHCLISSPVSPPD
ncbi:hypothetical protein A7U60_g3873 [Sanghuangporus baumii]|uniref:Carbohydrate esterase family 16 protein n=1 Tax=Sanghuangporus baumii TaxID=108892 RepID=A0A9Q5HZJ8_SANBA|nr:hypothetical protein A7U60_g3873 [Sanghuangporus baumii]